MQTEPAAAVEPTAFEQYEREQELRIANLKRGYAERMDRVAELIAALEGAVSAIDDMGGPDALTARRYARARKALGWDYDADAAGEVGAGEGF